jgi:hypothetical protein
MFKNSFKHTIYMHNLPRKRLLGTPKGIHPRAVVGKTLHLPDLQRYLEQEHQRPGWSKNVTNQTQAKDDFRFDGRLFKEYANAVMGRQINKIYFPAAYTGKVALALKEQGYDVLASDLSSDWVANLGRMGLASDKRSFEQIPKSGFDAIVSFEPFCIPPLIKHMAFMRALSESIPFIVIYRLPWKVKSIGKEDKVRISRISTPRFGPKGKVAVKKGGRMFPSEKKVPERLAYDYGAKYHLHLVSGFGQNFRFHMLAMGKNGSEQIRFDLNLLEQQHEWASSGQVSLSKISRILDKEQKEVAAAFLRLMDVFNRRFGLGQSGKGKTGPPVSEALIRPVKICA